MILNPKYINTKKYWYYWLLLSKSRQFTDHHQTGQQRKTHEKNSSEVVYDDRVWRQTSSAFLFSCTHHHGGLRRKLPRPPQPEVENIETRSSNALIACFSVPWAARWPLEAMCPSPPLPASPAQCAIMIIQKGATRLCAYYIGWFLLFPRFFLLWECLLWVIKGDAHHAIRMVIWQGWQSW